MPPGNPEGYGALLRLLEGQQGAPVAEPGLGASGIAVGAGLLGGSALATRRFAPGVWDKTAGRVTSAASERLAARQAGSVLGDLSGTNVTAKDRAGRLASRLGARASSAASKAGPAARAAATTARGAAGTAARRALPWAARGAGRLATGPVGAAALGAELGTMAGQAIYDTEAGQAYAGGVNSLPVVGDVLGARGDSVFEEGEAKGLLGNVGRAFAFLPGGPDHDLPERMGASEQSPRLAQYDTDGDGHISEAEHRAGMSVARQGAANARQAADEGADGFGRVLEMLEDRAVGVEQDYQDRVGELRSMYQLAETPEERAQLQYALGTLEAQRQAGHTVIQNAYGQAMSDNAARAEGVREAAGRQAADVAAIYDGAAADVQGVIGDAEGQYADSGLGVGATEVSGNVTDWVPLIEGEGARSAALAGQLGQIAADDMAFLGAAMAGEQGAQQGDLERLALAYGAQATMDHNRRVQDRVAQERMALAGQTAQAQQFYDTRRYGLDDTAIQMALDMYAQERAAGGAGDPPIIPNDPQGAYIAGLDMLAQYGQAALPFIANNGLIPPEELAVILSQMGAVEPQPAG